MVSVAYTEAATEVLDILEHMEECYISKVPKKFMEFLEKNKDKDYNPNFDHSKKLNELNLKEKTKDILAIIYMNYWCDESKKIEYKKLLNKNEKIYQEKIREKYNPDNIFKKKEEKVQNIQKSDFENLPIEVQKEESFFRKIINFIKNIIKK